MTRIDLQHCTIIAAIDRPGWVDQAVLDLAEYTHGTIQDEIGAGTGPVVLVGREAVRTASRICPELREAGLDGLTDQGFVLAAMHSECSDFVVCSGGGSRGDAYAVIELIKAIDKTEDGSFVDEMARREEPFFVRRGMYAHQHWAYAYPYALRTWEFEDWCGYIDLLAYLKINLLQIWSMAGILPTPLSDGDRGYLENYHRIIDYAKNRRGMEVYIGECANNVAEHDGGKPVAEREYFDVEVLKNPADPKQFQDIMANRRNLYSVASNADGYWIIDSDPGGYDGSSVREFVDILIGNRKLIDELTDKGVNAKLIYWMWYGWAKGVPVPQRMQACGEAVEQMRDRLKEPWSLLACKDPHPAQVSELGYVDKSIFFPYGILEREPSQPMTRLRFDELYDQLNGAISRLGIKSVMGNAQTPFLQLPNMFFMAESAWHGLPPKPPDYREIVERLARLIAPDPASNLADAWLALAEPDAAKTLEQARKIEGLASKHFRMGSLGERYAPGVQTLLADLAKQLLVHAAARTLIEALETNANAARLSVLIEAYAQVWFAWQRVHGFEGKIGGAPDSIEIATICTERRQSGNSLDSYADEFRSRLLSQGLREKIVDAFLSMFKSDPSRVRV